MNESASWRRDVAWTVMALFLLLAWDASGLDLPLASLSADGAGFALRDNVFLVRVLHEGGRFLSWAGLGLMLVALFRPFGVLRQLDRAGRLQLVLSLILSVIAVTLVKHGSTTSCPWDLEQFGGAAHHVSHWAWGVRDGGPGRCFPAGHASAGFAWLGGYFVLRSVAPRAARRWLWVALVAGFTFGVSQQLRGAHYASHTLWTAWICWSVSMALDALFQARQARRVLRFSPSV
ncbi:phosphatase PAP2 family protein [Variovorax dokdonensis]|uniref:Phosphatase PAP2 family protein n=1 Tax=Variovorax dokdonensis TaxID=344883 RepID=A0ABT7NDK6_9BURK|nr:phosphatase PAP2 family protein [Variovorax dokdonensis]MDM0046011.1 phosphatase PAP2 family protein [Variovorax dokdonensis]